MQTTNNRDTDTNAPKPKKLFLPLCHNGSGDIKALFTSCLLPAFAGREYELAAIGDSHAGRQCNKMANLFLDTDCTHMLVIDCDIYFSRVHVDRILSHDLPLVYGLYPKKQLDTPACVCGFNDGVRQVTEDLVQVRRAGRGFMLVAREVFERMKEDNGGHAKRYHNHGKVEWEFFESGAFTGEMSCYNDGEKDEQGFIRKEFLSEDWAFCERARQIGIPTLVDTRINLGHEGSFLYEFGMNQLSKMSPSSWQDIEGWCDFEEVYRRIAAHLSRVEFPTFVEVGAWMGKSIALMCSLTSKETTIYAVDTFLGSPEEENIQQPIIKQHGGDLRRAYDNNLKALGIYERVRTIQMTSLEAAACFMADECLDAVFIDAAHTFDSVKEDIEAWLPKVKRGGILAGHDYDDHFPGVRVAVNTVLGEGKFEVIGKSWYFVKGGQQ